MTLRSDIEKLLNRYSAENGSDTPDYVLAVFLMRCLDAFDKGVRAREQWYGRPIPGTEPPLLPTAPKEEK